MSQSALHFGSRILKQYRLKYLHAYHPGNPSQYRASYNAHGLRNAQIASYNESDLRL